MLWVASENNVNDYTEWLSLSGRIMQANRRATNRQIKVQYNSGVQNSNTKYTTRWSLSRMGCCSRRPHWRFHYYQPKTRKKQLRWAHDQQHWTIEEWKNITWNMSSVFLSGLRSPRPQSNRASLGWDGTLNVHIMNVPPSNLQQLCDAIVFLTPCTMPRIIINFWLVLYVCPQILKRFYSCTIESILTGCITAWYGDCSASDRKALQRVLWTAQYITGAKHSAIQDLYTRRCQRKALKIVKDSRHPSHRLFSLLPYRSAKSRSTRGF